MTRLRNRAYSHCVKKEGQHAHIAQIVRILKYGETLVALKDTSVIVESSSKVCGLIPITVLVSSPCAHSVAV